MELCELGLSLVLLHRSKVRERGGGEDGLLGIDRGVRAHGQGDGVGGAGVQVLVAAVCGDKLEDVSLEFVEPEAVTTAVQAAPAEYEADEAVADAAGAAAITAVAVEPGTADSTSEITVPMGASHDGAGEA